MKEIIDQEFGVIEIRHLPTTSRLSVRVTPKGTLRISAPKHTPKLAIRALIAGSRQEIRSMLESQRKSYLSDQQIGKSHSLVILSGQTSSQVTLSGTVIVAKVASGGDISQAELQSTIRAKVLAALRKEAKSYLPRRLEYLARAHGFEFEATKLTHASSRWGSCSSTGTISLNISLMQLPFELIDYVLVHELAHTRQMNHSSEFWQIVESIEPNYKKLRHTLKGYTPHV